MIDTNNKRSSVFFLSMLLAAFLVLLDQLTKQAAERFLGGKALTLIPRALELTLVHNIGAAFGMGQGAGVIFVAAAAVISVGIIVWLWSSSGRRGEKLMRFSMILLLAGAVGNAIDRVRLGYVTDFIYFSLIDFPVFNVADICVTVGCVLLVISILLPAKQAG